MQHDTRRAFDLSEPVAGEIDRYKIELERAQYAEPSEFELGPKDRLIPLNKGFYTVVSEEVYEALIWDPKRNKRINWTAWAVKGRVYAVRKLYFKRSKKQRRLYLHREVMRFRSKRRRLPKGKMVDHINGSGLDNRNENLRFASPAQNGANTRRFTEKGLPRGVSKKKKLSTKPYWAQIKVKRRCIHLGSFALVADAARAYDRAAVQHFGSFAILNYDLRDYEDVFDKYWRKKRSSPPQIDATALPEGFPFVQETPSGGRVEELEDIPF